MTIPVYVPGITINDNGNLVLDVHEMDAAGVGVVELVEMKERCREAEGGITQEEFCINFSRAVAEDDFTLWENTGAPLSGESEIGLSNAGLDNLTNIAATQAEPLFDRISELEARLKEAEALRISYLMRAEKAEARAEAAEKTQREMGEEGRKMTDEIERLSVAVEWVLQEIREKIAVERGLKTASIQEYFRVYKRVSIGFYDKDVARLQAALSPAATDEQQGSEGKE